MDQEAHERIQRYVEIGKGEARLAFEGTVPEGDGYFIAPTIFAEVPPTARVAREEIFGPVLAVLKAKDLDEAIQLANDTEFALTGGLYSRSPANIERVKRELTVGNLYINRTITGAIVARHPFGGFKMSGGGTKAGGRDYLLNFVFPRVVTENVLRRGFAPVDEGQGELTLQKVEQAGAGNLEGVFWAGGKVTVPPVAWGRISLRHPERSESASVVEGPWRGVPSFPAGVRMARARGVECIRREHQRHDSTPRQGPSAPLHSAQDDRRERKDHRAPSRGRRSARPTIGKPILPKTALDQFAALARCSNGIGASAAHGTDHQPVDPVPKHLGKARSSARALIAFQRVVFEHRDRHEQHHNDPVDHARRTSRSAAFSGAPTNAKAQVVTRTQKRSPPRSGAPCPA